MKDETAKETENEDRGRDARSKTEIATRKKTQGSTFSCPLLLKNMKATQPDSG